MILIIESILRYTVIYYPLPCIWTTVFTSRPNFITEYVASLWTDTGMGKERNVF